MGLRRIESLQITVAGEPVTVYIQPLTPGRLARLGLTETPSLFANEDSERGDAARALQFLFSVILAGVVAVQDAAGLRYRLRSEPDPVDPSVITPDDLEEPGLKAGAEAYANLQIIFRRIMEISGMEDLFRGSGAEDGASPDRADRGPGAAPAGENLSGGPVDHLA